MTTHSQPVLALDLGGTQLRTAIALPDGTLAARRAEPTPHAADVMVEAATRALRSALDDAANMGIERPVALGISAPGPLDPQNGILIDPPNLDRRLWGFPLARALGDALGVEAVFRHDTPGAGPPPGGGGAAPRPPPHVCITGSISTRGGGVIHTRPLRCAPGPPPP